MCQFGAYFAPNRYPFALFWFYKHCIDFCRMESKKLRWDGSLLREKSYGISPLASLSVIILMAHLYTTGMWYCAALRMAFCTYRLQNRGMQSPEPLAYKVAVHIPKGI